MSLLVQFQLVALAIKDILSKPVNSLLMGLLAGFVVIMRLVAEHFEYNTRRAKISTLVSAVVLVAWYVLMVVIIDPQIDDKSVWTVVALTFLVVSFITLGVLASSVFASFFPQPVIKFKLWLIRYMKETVKLLEDSLSPEQRVAQEQKTVDLIKQIVEDHKEDITRIMLL